MTCSRKKTALHYFTLVELLIVIAIIGLLVSMLSPALRSARLSAILISCINNQKQLLTANILYSTEYDDKLPFCNWASLEDNIRSGWLYKSPNFSESEHVKTGLLWPYLKSMDVYKCPGDEVPDPWINLLTSYLMNGAVNAYGNKFSTYKISEFRAEDVLFFELDDKKWWFWNDGSSFPSEVPSHMGEERHFMLDVLGYFDGHVNSISSVDYFGLLDLKPGPLWCNPNSSTGIW